MKVTATSFMTTSFDQILSPRGVEGSEAARATRLPIETVAKLKGKDPMSNVMKKGLSGRRRTPEMTYKRRENRVSFDQSEKAIRNFDSRSRRCRVGEGRIGREGDERRGRSWRRA